MVIIILQYLNMANQHVVHLNLTWIYMSIIPQLKKIRYSAMIAKPSSALSVLHREATVISSRYKAGIVNLLPKIMNDFMFIVKAKNLQISRLFIPINYWIMGDVSCGFHLLSLNFISNSLAFTKYLQHSRKVLPWANLLFSLPGFLFSLTSAWPFSYFPRLLTKCHS